MKTTRTPTHEEILKAWSSLLSAAIANHPTLTSDLDVANAVSENLGLAEPMTPGAIANYRNGWRCPGPAVQAALAAALGVPGRDLFPLDIEVTA